MSAFWRFSKPIGAGSDWPLQPIKDIHAMNHVTANTHQSKIFPDVSFAVLTLSEGRRIALAEKLAGKYEKIDQLRRESKSTIKAAQAALEAYRAIGEKTENDLEKLTNDQSVSAAADIQKRIDTVLRNEIYIVYVRDLLSGVDGLVINGVPATPETLISDGPLPLYEEILAAVKVELGLSEDEAKN